MVLEKPFYIVCMKSLTYCQSVIENVALTGLRIVTGTDWTFTLINGATLSMLSSIGLNCLKFFSYLPNCIRGRRKIRK